MGQRNCSVWARSIRDPEAFDSEQAALGQFWTLLGLTIDIPNDNDWIRCSLGGGSVFVQRFGSTIKGFENICRHRFHPIRTAAKGSGLIRCAFHHWIYNHEGEAVGIPKCKKLFGMSPKELGVRLRSVEIATCGVLIFGRFPCKAPWPAEIASGECSLAKPATKADPPVSEQVESLEEFLGEAWPILRAMCREGIRPGFCSSDVKANWKLINEISMEEYHTVAVHPTSLGRGGNLDLGSINYTRFGRHSSFFYKGKPGNLAEMASDCTDNIYRPNGYKIFHLFPGLAVNHLQVMNTWFSVILQYEPRGHDRTTVRSWYFRAPFVRSEKSWLKLLFQRYIELFIPFFFGFFLRRILNEDHAICEAMQAAAGSVMEEPILGLEEQRIAWFRDAYWEALAQSSGRVNADARSDDK